MLINLKQPLKNLQGQNIGFLGGILTGLLLDQSCNDKKQILDDYKLAVELKDLDEKELDIDEVARFRKLTLQSQNLNVLAKAQILEILV